MFSDKVNLRIISDAKVMLMGFAIIWIVLHHANVLTDIKLFSLPFSFLYTIGDCGVDIFLILSGFGIYCSLFKNSDELSFYKR